MQTSQEIKNLAIALSKAQREIDSAKKTTSNDYFKSKYADLAEVWNAIREALTKNEIAVIQTPTATFGEYVKRTIKIDKGKGNPPEYREITEREATIHVETRLVHSSGEWIEEKLSLMPNKNDCQSLGSAITYARRYSLAALAGVTQDDDDANLASGRDNKDSETHERKPALPRAPKNPPAPPKTPPAPPAPPTDNKKSEADKAQEAAAAALPTGANTSALPFADAGSKYNMEKIKAVVNDDLKKLFGKLQMKSAEIVEYWNAFDGDQEAIKNAIESAQKEAGK